MIPLLALIVALPSALSMPTGAAGIRPPQELAQEDFQFVGGGITLAGNLTLPEGEGPHPVILLTHGSEPGSRRGYGMFVDLFARQGIAVMRYDKRGVGNSEGTYIEAPDLRIPCADLLGAVSYLRAHASIDAERIGVFGASQGGWVAPMAASMSEHIRFVVVQSAPGVSPLEQNLFDKGNQLRRTGLSEPDLERAGAYRRAYWTYLITGAGFEAAQELHTAIASEPWFTRDNFAFPFQRREEFLRYPILANWALHSAYEPRLTLERVRVPLLAVFGGEDSIVPVDRSVSAFTSAFAMSGNEALAINVIRGADHGIRVASPEGWRAVSREYMDLMVQWVAEQVF